MLTPSDLLAPWPDLARRMHSSRRQLLVSAAAGGGLLVAWKLLPRHYPLPLRPGPGETSFGAWLTINQNGIVTVAVPQLEMGQGVTTLIAQIVAVELGADWRQVAVQPAPISEIWANAPLAAHWAELWCPVPAWGQDEDGWLTRYWAEHHRFMTTADGTSLAAYEMPARMAASSARSLLAMAAAAHWNKEGKERVDWRACDVSGGMVRHDKQSLAFGELATAASRLKPPEPPILLPMPVAEPPSSFPVGSQPAFPRLDIPAKLDGSFVFAGDVRLPDMVFAAIRHAPPSEGGSRLTRHDVARAKGVAGFHRLITGPDWLAATATNWWAAEQALRLIQPRFRVHRPADTVAMEATLDKAVRDAAAHRVITLGDADSMLGSAPATQRYDAALALHAGLETATATAQWHGGWIGRRLELWVATQAPEQTRQAVAGALGIPVENIILYPIAAGGSFDARLETPHAVEAALIAREVGRPVQLVWSRWQEQVAGIVRPPVAAVLSARLTPDGAILAWKARLALPASAREFGRRLLHGDSRTEAMAATHGYVDPLVLDGAVPPYAIPNLTIEHVPTTVGIPTGRLRGNAHGYTAFFTESFLDELAASLKREPLSFRMAMLSDDSRLAQCLQRVSTLAKWNGGGDGSGNGLACHRMGDPVFGGCIAAIATARQETSGKGAGVRVDRIFAVADIGRIVNVDIARQQIEGGLIYGIGLALGSSSGFAQGLPLNGRLAGMGLPTLGNCPEIVVEFMASDALPFDPGELGVAVAAPAIANALASATGMRFRKLPLLFEEE